MSRSALTRIYFGSAVLLLSCRAVRAQPVQIAAADVSKELKRLSLGELSQIEVTTVSKAPQSAFRMPAAVYVLTPEDIRRSGATNIPDLLRLVPGVEVAQIDSDKWAIGIRGFQGRLSKAMRVLIDGRSIYTPLFAGVYWEMHHVMLEDVERIEIVRGPGATVWGSNAVNGVVNIITKHSRDTRGLLVSSGAGNVQQGHFSTRYGGGDDRLSYRLYAMGLTVGPQHHQDNRRFDDWRMGQFGFRMDWALNQRDSLTLQGDAYGMNAGQKLVLNYYSPPSNPAVEANGDFYGQNVRASWQRKLANGADFRFDAYLDRTDRQDLNYREIRNSIDFDLIHHIPFRRHDVIWGLGARTSPSHFLQRTPTVDFIPHEETYNLFSGFVQDEIALTPDRLSVTLGAKFEHNSYSGWESQPSARLSWTPNREHTFWAAITRAVRTPSRIEEGFRFTALAVPTIPLYLRLIGDGQFSPEQLIGYEAGVRWFARKSGFISVALFHNRYDDLLSVENRPPAPESDPAPLHFVLPLYLRNGIRATTSGGEIAGLFDPAKWWRLQGSYSYLGLNATRKPGSNDASTVGQLEGDSPAHKIVIQSLFTLPKGFQADLTWRYVSEIPDQKVASYKTGDARIGRRIPGNFEISLVGRNLFQPYHFEYGGDPGPLVGIKRSIYLKVTWTR